MYKSPILNTIEAPQKVIESWQESVNLLADIAGIPAALIMRVHAGEIEVLISSNSAGNVYHRGKKSPLKTGLYCETVISTQRELLVPNALSDPAWDHNPDIELGMISYFGLPLIWPTGEIFGTICILDKKENAYSQRIRHLMEHMRDSIQFSLQVICDVSAEHKHADDEMLQAYAALELRVQERTSELAITNASLLAEIAERKRTEEVLRTQETHLNAILEATADGILAVDTKGNVIRASQRFSKIWRIPESILASGDDKTLLDFALTQLSDPDAFLKKVQSLYESDAESFDTFAFKDGRFIERYSFAMIMGGKSIGRVWSFRDITERKAIEASLTTALLRAEAASRAKSEFLGVMSHEVRTPLNGVLGSAELLAESSLDSEQMDYVKAITSSGEHLLAIVSDILDFASIEAGTLAIHVAPLAVAELVKAAESTVRKAATEKGIELRCELAAGTPEQIIGDELRMRQILINLLGNAVKFTASGSVVLSVATDSDREGHLDFSVEDTGIGISSEDLSRLFQPFVQADSKGNRRFGGSGLGLAISRRIAEAMGATITAASTPGKGSLFTFRFPLESASLRARENTSVLPHISNREKNSLELIDPCPPIQTGPSPTPTDEGLVLVVDDNRTSSMIAGKMLERLGYRVEFAASGDQAVEAFVPGKFSAILMDMAMPMMDGLEATGKIREIEAPADSHVPIIAFTANVLPGERERCLAAGMDDFLSKPLRPDDLAAKLANRHGPQ